MIPTNKFNVYCTYRTKLDLGSSDKYEVVVNDKESLSREEFLEKIRGCHGILCEHLSPKFDAEALDAIGGQLKVISTASAGYDHIDVAECKRRGIKVGYLPCTFSHAVAEISVGLVLTMSRKIVEAAKLAITHDWNKMNDQRILTGRSIRGSTVGIFGLGGIGLSVAKKLIAFDIKKIIYNNRKESQIANNLGYEYVSFEKLLSESDYLICCASLNKDSEGIFDSKAFAMMKKSSTFVNVGRGGMVNHNDLYEALKANKNFSAGLDVTAPEPLPSEHPLFTLSNCVITPHIAGDDEKTREDLYNVSLANLINGLNDSPLIHQLL